MKIFPLLVGLTCIISSSALSVNRRLYLLKQTGCIATLATTTTAVATRSAHAADVKSRTDGYAIQHTDREWAYILSGPQYNILRQGGTERQKASILHTFTMANVGTYTCAGCATPLFSSEDKFSSGTGWPSFSSALPGVEVEELDPVRATLDGREVRCSSCGGHLGDLFNDGWIYRGSSAAKTGKRYCIDGAALVFKPEGGGEDVFGDDPPPNRVIKYEQSMYRDS
mmetsp:Transcript_16167/g.29163  ORF Transcript_16167/g.29163 Transcript_16167/m.29163 type:complete len:226 (-) Transcript_16167:104-781(-)